MISSHDYEFSVYFASAQNFHIPTFNAPAYQFDEFLKFFLFVIKKLFDNKTFPRYQINAKAVIDEKNLPYW